MISPGDKIWLHLAAQMLRRDYCRDKGIPISDYSAIRRKKTQICEAMSVRKIYIITYSRKKKIVNREGEKKKRPRVFKKALKGPKGIVVKYVWYSLDAAFKRTVL